MSAGSWTSRSFENPKSALRASLKRNRLGSLRDLRDERDEHQGLDKVAMSAKELQERSDARFAYSRRRKKLRLTCLGLKAEGAVPDNATCVQAALQALIREEQNCPVERHDDKDADEDEDDDNDDGDA